MYNCTILVLRPVENDDFGVGTNRLAQLCALFDIGHEERSAARPMKRQADLSDAMPIGVRLDHRAGLAVRRQRADRAPVRDYVVEVDSGARVKTHKLAFSWARRFRKLYSYPSSAGARSRFPNLVVLASKARTTRPIGPCRCLPMMTSAVP